MLAPSSGAAAAADGASSRSPTPAEAYMKFERERGSMAGQDSGADSMPAYAFRTPYTAPLSKNAAHARSLRAQSPIQHQQSPLVCQHLHAIGRGNGWTDMPPSAMLLISSPTPTQASIGLRYVCMREMHDRCSSIF